MAHGSMGVLRVYFQNEVHPTNNSIIRSYTMQNNITNCKRCTYVLFLKKTKRRYLMILGLRRVESCKFKQSKPWTEATVDAHGCDVFTACMVKVSLLKDYPNIASRIIF